MSLSSLDPVEMLATARAAEINGYSLSQVQAFLSQNQSQFLASISNPKSAPSAGEHSQPNSVASVGSVGSVGSNFSATSQHGVEAENANATTPPLLLPWGTNPYMPMVVLSMPSTSNVASNLVNVLANSPLRPRFTSLSENIQPDAGNKPAGPMMLPMGGIDTSGIGLPNGNLHDGLSKKSPVSKAFNAQNPLKSLESSVNQHSPNKRKADGSFVVQKQSPPSSQYPQSQQPSTSANFTVPTSRELNSPNYRGLPVVPRCSICGADSTGIHFGVEACAACSAFFRRTVVLNKNYICNKDGNCSFNKDSPTGQKCRACRFKKCIDVGMDRNAVQHRRDAIGKYSSMVKRECASPTGEYDVHVPGCSTSSESRAFTPSSPKSPKVQQTILNEMLDRYDDLNKRRRIFYCNSSISALFQSADMEPVELTNFGDSMFQLWRIEPRLYVEFISDNRFLTPLSSTEKTKILSNFLLIFQAVEEPYITWKYCGLDKKVWVMANRTYIDLDHPEKYFEKNSNIMKDLNLDKTSAVNLFKPSFMNAMETIGARMADMNITKTELVALIALVLLDPTNPALDSTSVELLVNLRNQLFKDLMHFYEADDNIEDPEVRMGNLILIMSGIKVHAQKSQENMQLLKVFDVIPRDQLFDEVTGIAPVSS